MPIGLTTIRQSGLRDKGASPSPSTREFFTSMSFRLAKKVFSEETGAILDVFWMFSLRERVLSKMASVVLRCSRAA